MIENLKDLKDLNLNLMVLLICHEHVEVQCVLCHADVACGSVRPTYN